MKINSAELRRDPNKVLRAIENQETVLIMKRGREIARVVPASAADKLHPSSHPAFGMWADRKEMQDPGEYVRNLRRGRFDDL